MTEAIHRGNPPEAEIPVISGMEYQLAYDGLRGLLYHEPSEFKTFDDVSAKLSLVPQNTRLIVEKVLEAEAEKSVALRPDNLPVSSRKNLERKVDEEHAIDIYYGRLNLFMDRVANEKRVVFSAIQMPAKCMDLRLLVYASKKEKEQLHAIIYPTSQTQFAGYYPAEYPNDTKQMEGFFSVMQSSVESFLKVIPKPENKQKIELDPFFNHFNKRT